MKILFLGDVVGAAGCSKLTNNLLSEIKSKNIDFVIVNGENAASQGVGLTKEICKDFFNCGVNVILCGSGSNINIPSSGISCSNILNWVSNVS